MIDHIVPPVARRWLLASGFATITAAAATGTEVLWLFVGVGLLWSLARGDPTIAGAVLLVLVGVLAQAPALPEGAVEGRLSIESETYGGRAFAGLLDGTPVVIDGGSSPLEVGHDFDVNGTISEHTMRGVDGRQYQTLDIHSAVSVEDHPNAYERLGRGLREHVSGRLVSESEPRSLLAGFLVGDTSGVAEVTVEAMRKAGISHFVAVSGSNVALYLLFVYVVSIPMGIGPRRRAAAGLIGLPIFIVATGFEPSVLRASSMAALVLAGRVVGVTLETWQVIALATTAMLALDPWLVRAVGFQLSLGATCGVVIGSRMPHRQPSRTLRALSISLGAQVAVAPLLLAHFGTVPLLSPLTNLVVAPLVGAATTLATLGVVGVGPLLWPAEALAGMVIDLAHTASVWPQVDLTGLVLAAGLGALLWATWRRWPAPAVSVAALGLVVVIAPNQTEIADGEVVVMDVGQGDAILVSGGNHLVLVDGGPEGSVLLEALHRYGVRRIDLVVVTHGDSDHAGGLSALPGRVEVGAIWESTAPHRSASMEMLRSAATRHGIPVSTPLVGLKLALGSLELEVLGPTRRFASGNDQSIVLLITGPARTMLLTGDIEVFGQKEIETLRVDVLKVPHHGAGTSDPGWLSSVGASEAIISVGENDFGHPVDWVIDLLEEGGASVRRTDLEGDVAVDLTAES